MSSVRSDSFLPTLFFFAFFYFLSHFSSSSSSSTSFPFTFSSTLVPIRFSFSNSLFSDVCVDVHNFTLTSQDISGCLNFDVNLVCLDGDCVYTVRRERERDTAREKR